MNKNEIFHPMVVQPVCTVAPRATKNFTPSSPENAKEYGGTGRGWKPWAPCGILGMWSLYIPFANSHIDTGDVSGFSPKGSSTCSHQNLEEQVTMVQWFCSWLCSIYFREYGQQSTNLLCKRFSDDRAARWTFGHEITLLGKFSQEVCPWQWAPNNPLSPK